MSQLQEIKDALALMFESRTKAQRELAEWKRRFDLLLAKEDKQ